MRYTLTIYNNDTDIRKDQESDYKYLLTKLEILG
jgi:hypothetical protein